MQESSPQTFLIKLLIDQEVSIEINISPHRKISGIDFLNVLNDRRALNLK